MSSVEERMRAVLATGRLHAAERRTGENPQATLRSWCVAVKLHPSQASKGKLDKDLRLSTVDKLAKYAKVSPGWLAFGEGSMDRAAEPLRDFLRSWLSTAKLADLIAEQPTRWTRPVIEFVDRIAHDVDDEKSLIAKLDQAAEALPASSAIRERRSPR